jgi:putative addiction module component (TIGR02574 family)
MSTHPLLKIEISQLSISERIQLAEDLWDSILDRQDEVQLDPVQQQELDRGMEFVGVFQDDPDFQAIVRDILAERSSEDDSEVNLSYYSSRSIKNKSHNYCFFI